MRGVRLLLCTPAEMCDIDLLFRDSLRWDPVLEAKVLRTNTGDIAFKKEARATAAEEMWGASWGKLGRSS